jgi:hypothetical protein
MAGHAQLRQLAAARSAVSLYGPDHEYLGRLQGGSWAPSVGDLIALRGGNGHEMRCQKARGCCALLEQRRCFPPFGMTNPKPWLSFHSASSVPHPNIVCQPQPGYHSERHGQAGSASHARNPDPASRHLHAGERHRHRPAPRHGDRDGHARLRRLRRVRRRGARAAVSMRASARP